MAVTSSAIEASKKRNKLKEQNATISPVGGVQQGGTAVNPPTPTTPTPSAGTPVKAPAPTNTPMQGQGLRNADINYSQYGDDSSAPNQATPGGLNQKYTGEGVKNSQINYNQNLKTGDLGAMAFGQAGQQANSTQANYLATRNDNIASALYNEGKTSKEDIAYYLASQEGWNDSTEQDRVNTVEAIWKRLGDIAQQQGQNENVTQGQGQVEQQTTEQNKGQNKASIPQEEQENGVIYGRASGDKGSRIETNADPFSADAISLRTRQANLQTINNMDSRDIAQVLNSGASIFGETTMRDLMTYNPQKYQEILAYQKQLRGMDNVNSIAKGGTLDISAQTTASTDVVNNGIDNWIKENSTESTYGDVKAIITESLGNSQVAQTATQEMLNINKQIAELQEELDNLPKTAKKQFKGDVPQYIVDAYVSNNSQRIQTELNKLQTRYNSALDLYKTELSQKQWETEMMLKERQTNADINYKNWQMSNGNARLGLDAQQQAWNQAYQTEKLKYDNIVEINGKSYIPDGQGGFTELSSTIAYQSYQTTVADKMGAYLSMFPDGADGGQCEQFTDAFTYSTTGLKMEGASAGGETTAEEKAGYVNTWIPEVGSVAVFDYGILQENGVNYGHTMLVTAYDPNTGIITLKGSNKSHKPEEYEKVYTQTMSLADLNSKGAFLGFWNPYLDKVDQSYAGSVIGGTSSIAFPRANTPMTSIVDTLKGNAGTSGERSTIATAEMMYNTMYELEQGGYLDKLVQSGVVEDFINALDRKNFGKQGDERGSAFLEQLGKFIRNGIKDEEVAYAMNRLYQLVEQKLREESGAAISSSEWAMDFQLFLPQPGQSDLLRKKQLEAWDDIIYKDFSSAGLKASDYIPIFDYTNYSSDGLDTGRETW